MTEIIVTNEEDLAYAFQKLITLSAKQKKPPKVNLIINGLQLSSQAILFTIAKKCKLKKVTAKNLFITDDGLEILLQALYQNLNAKHIVLDISGNLFNEKCVEMMENLLSRNAISALTLPDELRPDYSERLLNTITSNDIQLQNMELQNSLLTNRAIDCLEDLVKRKKINQLILDGCSTPGGSIYSQRSRLIAASRGFFSLLRNTVTVKWENGEELQVAPEVYASPLQNSAISLQELPGEDCLDHETERQVVTEVHGSEQNFHPHTSPLYRSYSDQAIGSEPHLNRLRRSVSGPQLEFGVSRSIRQRVREYLNGVAGFLDHADSTISFRTASLVDFPVSPVSSDESYSFGLDSDYVTYSTPQIRLYSKPVLPVHQYSSSVESSVELSDEQGRDRAVSEMMSGGSTNLCVGVPKVNSLDNLPVKACGMMKVADGIYVDYGKPIRSGYHVYRGEQRFPTSKNKKPLAVKIYHVATDTNGPDGSDWHLKFCNEVDSMAGLHSHENVAELVHSGIVDHNLRIIYIAIRLYHEKTLGNIDWKSLGHCDAINIFLQICRGVQHLHESDAPVVHRDLKPSNILFTCNGKNVKVSDFSLSKQVEITRSMDRTTVKRSSCCGGTQGWMAAELLTVKTNEEDQLASMHQLNLLKSDVFSLGLLGHYVLCNGLHAFHDTKFPTDLSYCHGKIKKKEPPDLSHLRNKKNGHIAADLVEKMLNHDPHKRPNIEKVLQHFLFWDSWKKMCFLRDMNELFDDLKGNEDKGSDMLLLAYYPIPIANNEMGQPSQGANTLNHHASSSRDSEMSGVSDSSLNSSFSSPTVTTSDQSDIASTSDTSSQCNPEADDPKYFADFTIPGVADIPAPDLSDSSDIEVEFADQTQETSNAEVAAMPSFVKCNAISDAEFVKIPESRKREIFTEFQEVISDSFLEKIKMTGIEAFRESDEHTYRKNSLRKLILLIRNYRTHRVDPDIKNKSEVTWQFWFGLFPKLLPLLYRIMEPAFTEELKEQYKQAASPLKTNFKHLLEDH